jgi:uracil-DNA glycosylase
VADGESLQALVARARACRLCADLLPHGPHPVIRISSAARVLIVGQAPGSKVHATGIPWNDRSGDRLREWMGIDREAFYDESRIAIIPMGLCYPGVDEHGGDRPPIRSCAPLWHPQFARHLRKVRLTLLVGSYAQKFYLRERYPGSLGATIQNWRSFLPEFLPLPHPSWRNTAWLRRNPWFDAELVPVLRERLCEILPC